MEGSEARFVLDGFVEPGPPESEVVSESRRAFCQVKLVLVSFGSRGFLDFVIIIWPDGGMLVTSAMMSAHARGAHVREWGASPCGCDVRTFVSWW